MNLAAKWGKGPDEVWRMPADQVMLGFHYAKFLGEYDETLAEMNKPKR